ncbi:TonB-dependent receptor domain-containing protein [Shewanella marina]|uniref:TonB-dependent receptor domain-containing protein n=1 Tax=Shewanella marina TaxID=487319 RepID=UPI00046E6B0C|nr:TonB-dependent receptor [Shewanella marina]
MMRESSISRAVKTSLIVAFGVSGYATTTSAMAEEDQNIERIEVTGSRIIREGAIAPTPVTVITGEDLLNTGAINIAEVLNELPQLASTDTLGNSGTHIGTAGLNILNLRGMGTNRTLVLVDGKRHVSSVPGSAAVDINSIPTEWIDSVEIITGGASAIYGADAVTGVVNFKLKERIEGFNAQVNTGWAEDSGYNNQKLSVSYGTNFAEDRGNVAVSVEHAQQARLGMTERDRAGTSWVRFANPDGDTVYEHVPNGGHYRISNGGTTMIGDKYYTFNPDGSMREVNKGDKFDGSYCAGECDYINLKQWEELQPEFDRTTANFKLSYDVTDELTAYGEAKYSVTNATTSGQPAFFFFNPITTISRDNAFLSQEVANAMDAAGEDSITINRFMTDMGPRIEDDKRTTQRYVLGIKGEVGDGWDLDAYTLYGETEHKRTNYNNLIYSNFKNSVDAVFDADGNIVCRDEEARANGCVATNLFGNGSVSAAARDYISTTTVGTSTIDQFVAGVSLANSALWELPAGYVGVATGIEYRREASETEEDPFIATGDTFFNTLLSESGKFNVKEVFAEVSVPVLADLPGIQMLTVDGAVRYADYSSIGDATSWKVGLDWAIFDDLRIRSTLTTAIRAPNINELYSAQSGNFYSAKDSCKVSELDKLAPEARAIRAANCAALGVAADFDSDYDSSRLPGVSGGNDNLDAETSDSFTAGFVYQPSFIDNLALTVDYWRIEITDVISAISAQTIINRCIDSKTGIDNEYCKLITRATTSNPADGTEVSEITNIQVLPQNLAKSETEGVDFQLTYDIEVGSGDLKTNLLATYLIKERSYPFQEDNSDYRDYDGLIGSPQWQGQLQLTYKIEDWQFNWKTTYTDGVELYSDTTKSQYDKPYSNIMSYGSYATTDLFGTYNFDNGLTLGLGVDNVFDRDLPLMATGNGDGEGAYDNIGRFYYISANFKM